jgi:SAM-dependent methyltransferase
MDYHAIARYYDLIHTELTGDIELVRSLASGCKKTVLDLGCGTCRMSIPLARDGHEVVGIDITAEMLELAREKLSLEDAYVYSSVHLLRGNMTDFDLNRRFNLVVVSHNTLHEHPTGDIGRIFRLISKHLAVDGQVFLDLSNPFVYFNMEPGEEIWIEDKTFQEPDSGRLIFQRSTVSTNLDDQIVSVVRELKELVGDSRVREVYSLTSSYHLLFPHELELLLNSAGLRIQQLFGGFERQPFEEDSERLIVIAEKKREGSSRT